MAQELQELAPDVVCLPVGIANVYFVGKPGSDWVLVDTGEPSKASTIRKAAEERFGTDSRPVCILLTHGHFDHAGNARELAGRWRVPVYAHSMELPYLTGKSAYPPADPTAPGFMAFLSRFFSPAPLDVGAALKPLEAGPPPGLSGWEWIHTPGHTPGHVSFYRRSDALLLAGDAFTTVNLDSAWAVLTKKQRVSRPPTPMTADWNAAAASVRRLDALNPLTLGCGHGVPMTGPEAAEELAELAYHFPIPPHGRYVERPALADQTGVIAVPPAPPDPGLGVAGALGIATLTGIMFAVAAQRRKHRMV